MDGSATWTVVQGTIITSGISAIATGLYGIVRRQHNYGLLAGTAALNSGFTAATFFGIREYAIGPSLVQLLPTQQKKAFDFDIKSVGARDPMNKLSWSELRTHNLLDSSLSGAMTGGLLRGFKSGPRAVLPGALTVAAICSILQLAYNEMGIIRLKYIFQSRENISRPPQTVNHEHSGSSVQNGQSATQKFLSFLGVRRLSDEEYLEKMKVTRATYLQRIRELEIEMEEQKGKR